MMEMNLLNLMIEKALDEDGKRLFQDGHKASLRRSKCNYFARYTNGNDDIW